MKKLNVRMPDELIAELDAAARMRGVSRSAIIRERLEESYRLRPWDADEPLSNIRPSE